VEDEQKQIRESYPPQDLERRGFGPLPGALPSATVQDKLSNAGVRVLVSRQGTNI